MEITAISIVHRSCAEVQVKVLDNANVRQFQAKSLEIKKKFYFVSQFYLNFPSNQKELNVIK